MHVCSNKNFIHMCRCVGWGRSNKVDSITCCYNPFNLPCIFNGSNIFWILEENLTLYLHGWRLINFK